MDNHYSTLVSAPSARNFPAQWSPVTLGVAGAVLIGLSALFAPNLGAAMIVIAIGCLVVALVSLGSLAFDQQNKRRNWLLAAIVLVGVGGVAFLVSSPAYNYSIANAKSRGDFAGAITAERAAGEAPPYSADLAQTYLDWANAEMNAHAYQGAIDHLNYVAQKFPTTEQAAKANAQLPGAHLAWAQYATAQSDPVVAGQQYSALLTLFPSSAEAGQAHAAMPAAFLALGDALYKAHFYEEAYNAYQLITKNFPQSAQASQAHIATALVLGEWAQKLTDSHLYSDASQHYTDLAANYGDTTQGQQAKKLLTQGVQVIGRLFKADGSSPAMPGTTLRLSSKWTVNTDGSYSATGNQYFARTDANGYFVFTSIPAGQYLLEWHSFTGPYLTIFTNGKPAEIAAVIPLQPTMLAPVVSDQK